jgi:hypothetical protein
MASRVLWGYWVGVGLLVLLYLAIPPAAIVAAPAIVLSATVAVVAGVRRNRPRRAVPWLLFGGGIWPTAGSPGCRRRSRSRTRCSTC